MRGWLAEYLRARDRSGPTEDGALARMRFGMRPYVYDSLSTRRPVAAWKTGHIRAALLAAARDDMCAFVEIPFTPAYPNRAAEHLAQLRDDFRFETYSPAFFSVEITPAQSRLKVSLYDIEELRRVEAILAKRRVAV